MGPIVVIGGAAVDRKYRVLGDVVLGSSNPVAGEATWGGVARNVAENLAHLGAAPRLLSVVGEDAAGKDLLAAASRAGIDISLCQVLPGRATATYVAVLSAAGDLVLGLADMALFDALQPAWLAAAWPALSTAQWLFAECNLPAQTVGWLARRCREEGKWLAVDAVSVAKSARLPANLQGISLLFLNLDQARALTGLAGSGRHEQTLMIAALRHRGVAAVMLTSGGGGVLVGAGDTVTHVPAVPVAVVDVTGAGDSMIAGALWQLSCQAAPDLVAACRTGVQLASRTIGSSASVYTGGPDAIAGSYRDAP